MKKSMFLIVAALTALVTMSAICQTQTPRVDARERNQQKRIEQGVKSGQLTARETRTLERQEGRIRADKMLAKSDGVVTKAERHKLHRELNRESHRIYRKKHNERVHHG
jgi:hypothetical protein